MITPISIRIIDENKQVVYFKLIDGINEYFWHGNTPILEGQPLQNYLDGQLDKIKLLILDRLYPGAKYQTFEGETDLEKFEDWIAKGCKNPDGTVIKKVPFNNSWSEVEVDAKAGIEKSVFYGKNDEEIDTYVDANISVSDTQAMIKQLAKDIQNLQRRLGWVKTMPKDIEIVEK